MSPLQQSLRPPGDVGAACPQGPAVVRASPHAQGVATREGVCGLGPLQIAAWPLAPLPRGAPQGRIGCYPGKAILSAFYKQEGRGEGFVFV